MDHAMELVLSAIAAVSARQQSFFISGGVDAMSLFAIEAMVFVWHFIEVLTHVYIYTC